MTVKFLVGQDKERSFVKLYDKLMSNMDFAPPGASQPLVKPIDVDDVPIVALTLSGKPGTSYDDGQLRLVAEHMLDELRKVPGVGSSLVIGGRSRQVRVTLDPQRIAGYGLSPLQISQAITASNANLLSGDLEQGSKKLALETGGFFEKASDVKNAIVGVANGKPVYLGDVADVTDGFEETVKLTRISFNRQHHPKEGIKTEAGSAEQPAVTVALAKRQKLNAVTISNQILARVEELKKTQLPAGIEVTVTRNDGKTANDAVNELVFHLAVSVIVVIILLFLTLGWREAAIVALAIPLTLFITLGIGMVMGQTINRITLFALILSLGLLVDDAIVVVENIHRHYKLQQHSRLQGAILAVNEIGMPTILATLTVVLAFIPMAFVTGMMGPYMRPIPFNVPVAMITSLFVAFIVTPWASYRLMKAEHHDGNPPSLEDTRIYKLYKKALGPLLMNARKRRLFLAAIAVIFLVTMSFPLFQWVKFRMLPKANKNTFLVSIDMPAGSVLENTDRVARAVGDYLIRIPEVQDHETFVGTGLVMDFNGLLRGGAFREASHFADIRVNLWTRKSAGYRARSWFSRSGPT